MEDEKYVFMQDIREKGITARSSFSKRTHCGKGGHVRLPSDYMTNEEKEKMNGEVKSYRLNDPIKWPEFLEMPDDIKITYIKLLREKFRVPNTKIASMMGCSRSKMDREVQRLRIGEGKKSGKQKWDKTGFYKWAGIQTDTEPETVESVTEPTFTPDIVEDDGICTVRENHLDAIVSDIEERAIPFSGCVTFSGSAESILNTVALILGNTTGTITVSWTADGGAAD